MDKYVILEAFGLDRVGIIARLSEVLSSSNCNIEDSNISRLGQALTMMLLLRLPGGMNADELLARLEPVTKELDLRINIAELRPEAVVSEPPIKPHCRLTCHGADKIGIVHKVTKLLADQSINIIDMQTTVLRRANPEYIMELTLELPSYVDINELRGQLESLGKELGINIILRR